MISPKKKHQQKHIWDFTDTGGFQNSTGLGGGKGGVECNLNEMEMFINYWLLMKITEIMKLWSLYLMLMMGSSYFKVRHFHCESTKHTKAHLQNYWNLSKFSQSCKSNNTNIAIFLLKTWRESFEIRTTQTCIQLFSGVSSVCV